MLSQLPAWFRKILTSAAAPLVQIWSPFPSNVTAGDVVVVVLRDDGMAKNT